MKQRLSNEKYKGITIRIIKNILPSRKVVVEATMKVKGKIGKVQAPTKIQAVAKAKRWISSMVK